jgi:Flp pilus assembly protein TadB
MRVKRGETQHKVADKLGSESRVKRATPNRWELKRASRRGLTGWQLVAALCVVAAAGILTLLITQDVASVTVVVAPLLLVLGVSATRL